MNGWLTGWMNELWEGGWINETLDEWVHEQK